MKRGRQIRRVIRQLDKIKSGFSEEDYEHGMDKYCIDHSRVSLKKQGEITARKVYSDMALLHLYPLKTMQGVPSNLPAYITDTREAYVNFKENLEKGVLRNFPAVCSSFVNWQAYRTMYMWVDLDSRREFIKEFYEKFPEEKK